MRSLPRRQPTKELLLSCLAAFAMAYNIFFLFPPRVKCSDKGIVLKATSYVVCHSASTALKDTRHVQAVSANCRRLNLPWQEDMPELGRLLFQSMLGRLEAAFLLCS